jgi:hypothetical protein
MKLFRWFVAVPCAVLVLSAQPDPPISFRDPEVFGVDSAMPLHTVLSGDWNGDGKIDLAAIAGLTIWIFEGDGAGRFRPAAKLPLERQPVRVVAADLNSDGRTDLLVYLCTEIQPNCVPSGDFLTFISEGDFHFSSTFR